MSWGAAMIGSDIDANGISRRCGVAPNRSPQRIYSASAGATLALCGRRLRAAAVAFSRSPALTQCEELYALDRNAATGGHRSWAIFPLEARKSGYNIEFGLSSWRA